MQSHDRAVKRLLIGAVVSGQCPRDNDAMSQSKPRLPAELRSLPTRLRYAIDIRTKELGVSQNAIASAAAVDSGNLSKYLQGERLERIAASTLIGLARALNVRLEWLLTGVEPSGLDAEPESGVPGAVRSADRKRQA